MWSGECCRLAWEKDELIIFISYFGGVTAIPAPHAGDLKALIFIWNSQGSIRGKNMEALEKNNEKNKIKCTETLKTVRFPCLNRVLSLS
jgi:hypothetical protein